MTDEQRDQTGIPLSPGESESHYYPVSEENMRGILGRIGSEFIWMAVSIV